MESLEGMKATIVEIKLSATDLGEDEVVAGVTLELEDGRTVTIEAYDDTVELKLDWG
jgi:hypothetical protein